MNDPFTEALRAVVRAVVAEELAAQRAADTPDRLLSIPDAAVALGVSRTRLYREMDAGRLRTVYSGRRRLVPASAISEAIELMAAA